MSATSRSALIYEFDEGGLPASLRAAADWLEKRNPDILERQQVRVEYDREYDAWSVIVTVWLPR